MNETIFRNTLEKLYQENFQESRAAFENLVTTRPLDFNYSAKGISLVKCLMNGISFDMLKDLVQHGINVNEVYAVDNQNKPLGVCFEMKKYEFAAYLIYHKAFIHESFAAIPPIICIVHLIIQNGKVVTLL